MKFLPSQFAYLLSQRESRRNLKSLAQFVLILAGIVVLYAEAFHLIMRNFEKVEHSWITGLYWTLTVMTTLGFGDITFQTDAGRFFSIVVLMTGVVMLLTVLPFTFIRFFYAPWLEAQLHLRAPRQVTEALRDHVVICRYDEVAKNFVHRLELSATPYVVLEPVAATAAGLHADGVKVITGDVDSRATMAAAGVSRARMVFANLGDADNTNITLTVREESPDVPVVAIAEDRDAMDVLELSGASHVLPLKHRLGEQLAARVASGPIRCHVIGRYKDLMIAEFPVHRTMLAGKSIRDTHLRELTGLNVVAYWERGHLMPARPDAILSDYSVAVVVGSQDQVTALDAMFVIYAHNDNPVLVLGGGKVGRAAVRALKQLDIDVNIVDENPDLEPYLRTLTDHVFIGDAADKNVLERAGIANAPSVVLTANDDATNIYLAVYCRKLNPDLRIVSRITHERNLEAIHRAGADIVLSYTTLGVKFLVAFMQGRELVGLGEGADLYVVRVPASLQGKTLAESGIGAQTGLTVIAVQREGEVDTKLSGTTLLSANADLVMIGTSEQREQFHREFD
jgi:Trk K+ transport system NAD-binding subunit